VGLSNTRARLRGLYGEAHHFELLATAADGGFARPGHDSLSHGKTIMKIRTLIVDGRIAGARAPCASCSSRSRKIEIIGGMRRRAARRLTPSASIRRTLLFLDVQMARNSTVSPSWKPLGAERLPVIVFVTAHDQFCPPRILTSIAVDYLLKPVRPRNGFKAALRRAMERVPQRDTGALDKRIFGAFGRIKDRHQRRWNGLAVKVRWTGCAGEDG